MMGELEKIKEKAEESWVIGHEMAKSQGAPSDVCKTVAHQYMELKIQRELQLIKFRYPYLRI